MFWQISFFPRCEYHVFLSHCALDRDWLVHPVYEELRRQGVIPWLDQEDYYYGRDSRSALRDGLLNSRHVIFFVTLAMMDYRRGWCSMELAYADLLQANLIYAGGNLINLALPLFFLDRSDPEISRTIWGVPRDSGHFYSPTDGDPVSWAVDQIVTFLRREQTLAINMGNGIAPGQLVHSHLIARPGLIERVSAFDPGPIP